LAGAAFKDQQVIQKLQSFVPILVDGDTEKDVTSRMGIQGFPNVRFLTLDEKKHGEVRGAVPTATFLKQVDAALASIGPIRLTKTYKKLLKSMSKLKKALSKDKFKDALKAIKAVEKIGHEGPDLEAARAAKTGIAAKGEEALAEAKAMLESDPKKGASLLKKIQKDFKGLDVAKMAKELAE
jgi:thioredoxin-like negative regulator of GroEL